MNTCSVQVKEAKMKSYKNVYAKDPDASVQHLRTYHLNDEEETEIEQSDTLDGGTRFYCIQRKMCK